ncbi:MAG: Gfo/Idh/MocA family oxidoreductase [Acidobacteria bacterium]|nr:Gfo/Idh/MocA family oxidoreductase [Acidobacteriota bacterium]MCL5744968.1 Gfo/Idh/MocA family oxidoreductase [Acidobacteriota bacterium]
MNRIYRVGIIGFGHVHINHVAALYAAHPRVRLVACADTRPLRPELRVAPYTREWNRDYVVKRCGIPRCHEDYQEMLDQENLDVVIVTCENAQHPDVVEACAKAGASVCVEKPMAASLAGAQQMARACREAGTAMLVNWPAAWLPHARKAKELIAAGAIGRVLEVDYRVGDSGTLGPGARHRISETAAPMTGPERGATWWHQAAAGGGAMLDLCCYGAMYGRWYVGESATAALGMKANLDSQWGDAEDNGAIFVRFPQAIAIAQGSWTTFGKEYLKIGPVAVYGSSGLLTFDVYGERPAVRVERPGEMNLYEPEPLPAHRADVAAELFHHLETGEPLYPTVTPEFNLEVMAIMDAGARSAASGRIEAVNSAGCAVA